MQQSAELEDQAAALLAWMRALDPDHGVRLQLLNSGVRSGSVWALYPASFSAIQPALCKHLRTYGARGLRGREEELSNLLVDLRFAWQLFSEDVEALLQQQHDLLVESVSGRFPELEDELKAQFVQAQLTGDKAVFTSSALWYCWWFLSRPEQIPPASVVSIQEAAVFFGEHLLHLRSLGLMP